MRCRLILILSAFAIVGAVQAPVAGAAWVKGSRPFDRWASLEFRCDGSAHGSYLPWSDYNSVAYGGGVDCNDYLPYMWIDADLYVNDTRVHSTREYFSRWSDGGSVSASVEIRNSRPAQAKVVLTFHLWIGDQRGRWYDGSGCNLGRDYTECTDVYTFDLPPVARNPVPPEKAEDEDERSERTPTLKIAPR